MDFSLATDRRHTELPPAHARGLFRDPTGQQDIETKTGELRERRGGRTPVPAIHAARMIGPRESLEQEPLSHESF